ncbi:MAG: hypothetical protein AB4352_27125 [Hormoscilla sp.]
MGFFFRTLKRSPVEDQIDAIAPPPPDQKPGFLFQLWIRLEDISETRFLAARGRSLGGTTAICTN